MYKDTGCPLAQLQPSLPSFSTSSSALPHFMTNLPPDSRSHSKKRSNNRQSLQLPPHPLDGPIPPSLLQSHYLNSPESIFQRSVSASHIPSEEDEQWLQDTVPVAVNSQRKRGRLSKQPAVPSQFPSPGESSEDSRHSHSSGLQNANTQSSSHCAPPPSPPLVRWRHPSHLAPPAWAGQLRVRSAPCMAERGYFVQP